MMEPIIQTIAATIIDKGVKLGTEILGNRIKQINSDLSKKNKFKKINNEKLAYYTNKNNVSGKMIPLTKESIDALVCHIHEVETWAKNISFKDLKKKKRIDEIYIDLDTYLMPMRTHISPEESHDKVNLKNAIFESDSHCIILGQPGAGKTTSMKKICSEYIDKKLSTEDRVPVLIRFRDLSYGEENSPIVEKMAQLFRYQLEFTKELNRDFFYELTFDVMVSFLESLRGLLILEGFDEISNHSARKSALKEIKLLSRKLTETKMIITCRTGEFSEDIENIESYEIAPLTEQQIREFVNKWLRSDEKANHLISEMKNSPYMDTAIKPLSLAHLCAIYDRIGSIPDRPKTVYKKIVGLLLEEWDEQRSVERASLFAKFGVDRKFEFLTHLSFDLTCFHKTAVFDKRKLQNSYIKICKNFKLPESDSKQVVDEIEAHTGLFIQTGYDQYEFVHKSIQEYLTAEYIVRLPSINLIEQYIPLLGAELAIATSISTNPSLYFTHLVLDNFRTTKLSQAFYQAFISRILLEKPDFYPSDNIVLAAFTLLSELNNEKLIDLVKTAIDSSNVTSIMKYYNLATDEGDIVRLTRKCNHREYNIPKNLKLPFSIACQLQQIE